MYLSVNNNLVFATPVAICFALLTHKSKAEPAPTLTWNQDNVKTQPAPYEEGIVYRSDIYDGPTSDDGSTSYGGIIWEEGSVKAPGMKGVTDGDGDESCIMTSGFDPENPTEEKQCNDGFQTSKRFKRVSRDASGSVDLVFDVDGTEPIDKVYRIFEKYENFLGESIDEFTVELGQGIGNGFIPAGEDDGISFTNREGEPLDTSKTFDCDDQGNSLAAFFAFGLFGDAETNKNHDLDGYFDPTARSCFKLKVETPTKISTAGLSGRLVDVYGDSWLSKIQSPFGYFYDEDGDPSTENLLVADKYEDRWVTRLQCNSPVHHALVMEELIDIDECVDYDTSFDPVVLSGETFGKWSTSNSFEIGLIEDVGNVNLNYHIKLEFDKVTKFTLRITPNPTLPSTTPPTEPPTPPPTNPPTNPPVEPCNCGTSGPRFRAAFDGNDVACGGYVDCAAGGVYQNAAPGTLFNEVGQTLAHANAFVCPGACIPVIRRLDEGEEVTDIKKKHHKLRGDNVGGH